MAKALVWLPVAALASLLGAASVDGADYCDPSLCAANKLHVGCGKELKLSPACPSNAKEYEMTDEWKTLILDEHNKFRNELANGKVDHLPPAAAMTTLQWDDGLAETARHNALGCLYGHDACHNTEQFKNSGQNLARARTSADTIDAKEQMPGLINSWWKERHDATKRMIDHHYDPGKGIMVFHFAVMAQDRADRVGCAVTQWKNEGEWLQLYLVCNYSWNDFTGWTIYTKGSTASACKSGTNPKFPGLCSESESVPQAVNFPADG